MLATATQGMVRLLASGVRWMDTGLVESAARNAESRLLDRQRTALEELRTLRDLSVLDARWAAEVHAAPRTPVPAQVAVSR